MFILLICRIKKFNASIMILIAPFLYKGIEGHLLWSDIFTSFHLLPKLGIFIALATEKLKTVKKMEERLEQIRNEQEDRLKVERLRKIENEKILELEEKINDYNRAKKIREFADLLLSQSQFIRSFEDVEKLVKYVGWVKQRVIG